MNAMTSNAGNRIWKRLGLAGFVFFLVKGLAWLALPLVMVLTGVAD